MLTTTQWNALCKAQKHLGEEVGKTFYHKVYECEVTITHYTLSGQLFFKNEEKGINGYIWDKDYFRQYAK